MIKLFLILTIFCFPLFKLSAQNWLPGFVIVNERDTLWGEIDFRTQQLNQESAIFRTNRNSLVQVFSPKDIVGYRFTTTGSYFVSRDIEVNGNLKSVFVQVLTEGKLSLFYFADANRQSHFVFEKEAGNQLSITRNKDQHVGNRARRDNRFDMQIRDWLIDYQEIALRPRNFEFDRETMLEIVHTYHKINCSVGRECIVFENRRRVNTNFSVYSTIENNSFAFNNIAFGAEIEVFAPQISRHFGLYADASISKINYTWNSVIIPDFATICVDILPLTARIGIRCRLPLNNIALTSRAGISYKHLFGTIESDFLKFYDDDGKMLPIWDDDFVMNNIGIHLALGVEFRLSRRNALSLQFVFDAYPKDQAPQSPPIFSSSFATNGLRLGFTF